jgi:hypothetical protein
MLDLNRMGAGKKLLLQVWSQNMIRHRPSLKQQQLETHRSQKNSTSSPKTQSKKP